MDALRVRGRGGRQEGGQEHGHALERSISHAGAGVRIGSAEIYRAVEAIPEIADSLIVCCERPGDASSCRCS